jgi:hypothetical protein
MALMNHWTARDIGATGQGGDNEKHWEEPWHSLRQPVVTRFLAGVEQSCCSLSKFFSKRRARYVLSPS